MFLLATKFSVFCLSFFIVLFLVSLFLEMPDIAIDGKSMDHKTSIPLGHFRCLAFGGSLWFYTGAYPYCGSIIGIQGVWDGVPAEKHEDWAWVYQQYGLVQQSYIDMSGNSVGKVRFGDFPGIYYRHFETKSGSIPWWTLATSIFYPIALSAVLPCAWSIKRLRTQ